MTNINSSAQQSRLLKEYIEKVAQHRCKESFGILFDYFAPLLRSYSLSQEPEATLIADELVQEVMIKIWNKAHTYNPQLAEVNTWVFTLARNYRIDHLRRNGKFCAQIDPTELFKSIEDGQLEPFEAMQQQRTRIKVQNGLKQLPIDQSQVLAKVYLEGKSHQETAEELGLPLGTVKSRVRRALQKLGILIER